MINIIKGNILNATEDIICQQVNCKGVMGAGLAKQIKEKYPEVFEAYTEMYETYKSKPKSMLGQAQMIKCNDDKFIANLFGQFNYGTKTIQTNYEALHDAFDRLLNAVTNIEKYKGKTIAIPYNIGCGFAGGDWTIVYTIIEEIANYYNYDVTIYQLN